VLYCNDGDWVESCSALVENKEGQLSLIDWSIEREKIFQHKHNKLAESVSV
jgi:UDP-2,3-diacylglucosamine pyrophosphatase LpxH